MSDIPAAQINALVPMTNNTTWNQTPSPFTPNRRNRSYYHHHASNRSYGDLVRELSKARRDLMHCGLELQRIKGVLDSATAQANHDKKLIEGLQARITELEGRMSKELVLAKRSEDDSSSSRPAESDGGSGGLSKFPDFDPTIGPSADDGGNEYRPEAGPNPPERSQSGNSISQSDLFSPFPSRVLGPPVAEAVVEEPTYDASHFTLKISELWALTEGFAQNYTVREGAFGKMHVNGTLLELMEFGFDKNTVFRILNDCTRPLGVAKAINVWLTQEILKGGGVLGFDSTADSEITQLRINCSPGTPPTVRRNMYDSASKQLIRVRNQPLFWSYFNKRMYERARGLFNLLAPVIQHRSQEAWADMATIMKKAHEITLQLFCGPYEVKFTQAQLNEVFDPPTMIDREAIENIARVPDMMTDGRYRFRVKFSITPIMYFRNVSDTPPSPMDVVCAGQVLLTELYAAQQYQHQPTHPARRRSYQVQAQPWNQQQLRMPVNPVTTAGHMPANNAIGVNRFPVGNAMSVGSAPATNIGHMLANHTMDVGPVPLANAMPVGPPPVTHAMTVYQNGRAVEPYPVSYIHTYRL
ncbi:hypothetical protein VTO42DRAFT_5980 [Malbranchea cinnamomea]